MDDDGIMVAIYDEIKDELRDQQDIVKDKQLMVRKLTSLLILI